MTEDIINKILERLSKLEKEVQSLSSYSKLLGLKEFINTPKCDLGGNAWRLFDLCQGVSNARFLDLGVRDGMSSALMSFDAKEKNNRVCGCDVDFSSFLQNGEHFVDDTYTRYQADSVTLGKYWEEPPFDLIFVDTLHTREQVLAELYFWSNHLQDNGFFVFHDSHWDHTTEGDHIGGKEWRRVDEAITDFFGLPKNVMELTEYETDSILLNHFPGSYGMTFIKVKTLDAIATFKNNIDWKEVFDIRNELNDMHFNKSNPKFIDWNQDIPNIENELIITP